MHRPLALALALAGSMLLASPKAVPGGPFASQEGVRSNGSASPAPRVPLNRPPVIRTSLPAVNDVVLGSEVDFRVRAVDPDGDRVTLRLLNPLPGMVFRPAVDAASPVRRQVEWRIPFGVGGVHDLLFEAHDDRDPEQRVRVSLRFHVLGKQNPSGTIGFGTHDYPSTLLVGDVTGDGLLDVVALAHQADLGGLQAVGKAYVWAGGEPFSPTPVATLVDPGLGERQQLGRYVFRLADVTGDGVLDVVAASPWATHAGLEATGVVEVFAGGPSLSGTVAPTAVLAASGSASDHLSFSQSQGVYLRDLNGDDVLDLLVISEEFDVEGTADTGAAHVWHGGAGLTGTPAPDGFLFVPGAAAGDRLGSSHPESVRFGDVDGDGIEDVLLMAQLADVGGVSDAGAIHLWSGAGGFDGPPDATLRVSNASPGDQLGHGPTSDLTFRLEDLTGDGVLDVLAGSTVADRLEKTDAGALYLWAGGPQLTGLVSQSATFAAPTPGANDGFGDVRVERLRDVSGDGLVDLVVLAPRADQGLDPGAGTVFVWAGGPGLTGVPAPLASLGIAESGGLVGLLLEDVSGDGIADVVPYSRSGALLGGPALSGALLLWKGGPSLSGTPAPDAILNPTHPTTALEAVWAVDLSGDGIRDVVAASTESTIGPASAAGALFLWAGGSALDGTVSATTTFQLPTPTSNDLLTISTPTALFPDVTGDGLRDLLTSTSESDEGGVLNTGGVYVFAGPAGVGVHVPEVTLTKTSAGSSNRITSTNRNGSGWHLVDMDDDGRLDVVTQAVLSDEGASSAGRLYGWNGASLQTEVPDYEIHRATPIALDQLGNASGEGLLFADVTGDGILDLVVAASSADVDGISDSGGVFVHPGPLSPDSVLLELATPGASPDDQVTRR